ncbi:MAG: pitrilysin family protein [Tychonema bourrellyi B0820]|uniref:Insulinase family protein n=1 Tax=Tychonema bourrellyi FEM_GT703 TaxID=2040638 RepID=A0A2G4EVS4_9CYAN|nr:pitrilysin family protein [Tychonema bourrellyi]MDQ2100377.1 pitrilysin family protein [Tychonema bourrellyi B0820]PHX53540.1 insulinase family protein [Tychonema bourrellyi FEM_GT703]
MISQSQKAREAKLSPRESLKRQTRFLASLVAAVLLWWGISPQIALARENPANGSKMASAVPSLDRVINQVSEFKLNNGMTFIVLERPRAPVTSFLIHADVGGADEPDGQTGVAHYLEHLAFKGTPKIGTTDYKAEKPLLEKQDQLFDQIQAAKASGKTEEVAKLRAEFDKTELESLKFVNRNEFGKIVEQAGGVGLNAATSIDATMYFYSLPANKLELWMSLESERFLEPVFREFYKEKQVILEERRMRTENSPIGQMVEVFADKAFSVHPYRRPVIGYSKDIENLTRSQVQKFFDTYYVPSNLTVAVVGDVKASEVKRLAQLYFGRYKAKPAAPKLQIVEPPQTQTREITLKLATQPWYLEGYHRPAMNHPDNAIYEIIGSLLSSGRTSRLYKSLVVEKQLALAAQGFSGYPGEKYPNLMLFYAQTAPGRTVDEVALALSQEIERLKTEPVSAQELEQVKTQARAGLLRSLDSNMGMAFSLLDYQVKTGSWRNLFKQLDAIAKVAPTDIQRVSKATFRPENKTIGKLLPL